jgi:hypothetical protein
MHPACSCPCPSGAAMVRLWAKPRCTLWVPSPTHASRAPIRF